MPARGPEIRSTKLEILNKYQAVKSKIQKKTGLYLGKLEAEAEILIILNRSNLC